MVSGRTYIESNGVRVDCEGGNCQSRCLAYGATCSVCSKVYAGKGVNTLRDRLMDTEAVTTAYFRKHQMRSRVC